MLFNKWPAEVTEVLHIEPWQRKSSRAVLKPISSYISPETTDELREIANLSTARTKGTTGCSSASRFLLSETFDTDLKAPSSVWDGLHFKNLSYVVLFTGVFCNDKLQRNEVISHSHESNRSKTLPFKLLFCCCKVVFWSDYSNTNQRRRYAEHWS